MNDRDRDFAERFFCDAMLGGLARWLRAWGYDTAYEYGIDDRDLVQRALDERRTVLTSDGPLMERNVITSGRLPALFIPHQMSRTQQLHFVIETLDLPRRGSRCMDCGGVLDEVPKHAVAGEAPPLAFRSCDAFWRCRRCGKLYWQGTHWTRIDNVLDSVDASTRPPS